MAIHVAKIGLFKVRANGTVITGDFTMADRLAADTEHRVIPDAAIPNSANYPTIGAYLTAEDTAGFAFAHIDQYLVITQEPIP